MRLLKFWFLLAKLPSLPIQWPSQLRQSGGVNHEQPEMACKLQLRKIQKMQENTATRDFPPDTCPKAYCSVSVFRSSPQAKAQRVQCCTPIWTAPVFSIASDTALILRLNRNRAAAPNHYLNYCHQRMGMLVCLQMGAGRLNSKVPFMIVTRSRWPFIASVWQWLFKGKPWINITRLVELPERDRVWAWNGWWTCASNTEAYWCPTTSREHQEAFHGWPGMAWS